MLTVGSLFAGIGGFDLGFERAGFAVRWQVEQDGKAQSVLSHRFTGAKMYDDVRTVGAANLEHVDVICGGFPCQDVSVAGKREGLGGERTGLFSEVVRIARELSPRWMVLENVPGLLSSHRGRDFHTVLVALAECGFRRAYRILDSRYFGVAQRRRRVFIVLRAGGLGVSAASVLFEQPGGGGDSAAGDEARPDVTGPIAGGAYGTGRRTQDDPNLVTYAIGSHASCADGDQTNRSHAAGGPVGLNISEEIAYSLRAGRGGSVAFASSGERERALTASMHKRHDEDTDTLIAEIAATLNSGGNDGGFRTEPGEHLVIPPLLAGINRTGGDRPPGMDVDTAASLQPTTMGVRRLTPLECERLQGFPDGWTCLCGAGWQGSIYCECADSPRYRQLGNAVTVPVAEWIARRIADVEAVA